MTTIDIRRGDNPPSQNFEQFAGREEMPVDIQMPAEYLKYIGIFSQSFSDPLEAIFAIKLWKDLRSAPVDPSASAEEQRSNEHMSSLHKRNMILAFGREEGRVTLEEIVSSADRLWGIDSDDWNWAKAKHAKFEGDLKTDLYQGVSKSYAPTELSLFSDDVDDELLRELDTAALYIRRSKIKLIERFTIAVGLTLEPEITSHEEAVDIIQAHTTSTDPELPKTLTTETQPTIEPEAQPEPRDISGFEMISGAVFKEAIEDEKRNKAESSEEPQRKNGQQTSIYDTNIHVWF